MIFLVSLLGAALIAAAAPAKTPKAPPPPPKIDSLETAPAPPPPTAGPPAEAPFYWRTKAEKTDYRQTPDYDETMRYCRLIEGGARWVRVTTYGTSSQGRPLPLVILSKERAFTPEQAQATGKPIVLIQNGIHSGEIEGKDACLALMRDIAVLRTRESLLDHCIVLVLPIFSVDAHERRGRWNRINQNGPDEMGWRTTPIGLNLNRDYLKAEAPEMRALISQVFTRWWPHLLVDDHTTDGADFQHDVTYGINHGPDTPPPVERWLTGAFEARVVPRIAAMGHLPAPYISFRRGNDPLSGIDFGSAPPRFSTGYAAIQCRPAVLVETHMLKPYRTRVKATYDLLVALLEEINAHPDELIRAVSESEAQVVARGREPDAWRREVALTGRTTDHSAPFAYKGKRTRWEMSDITGALVPRYEEAPWDTIIPLYREMVADLVVRQPVGYLIPQEWATAIDRLDIHAVHYRRLARAWTDTVEVERIAEWSAAATPFNGHHPVTVTKVEMERRYRTYRPGDLWVPLDQRAGLVALHLLEAQAPDGLVFWNAFETALEYKEYAEDYVMEPIARDMMKKDPALAKEFQARLAADTSFAKSPQARIDFFYRRSPWADPEQNLNPAARALRPVPESALVPVAGAPAPSRGR